MAEHRHLATPQEQWLKFPDNLPANTVIHRMNRDRLPIDPEAGLHIEDIQGHVKSPADGRPLILRHYRQSDLVKATLPLLIYMHGGGFVTGSLETDDRLCRSVARAVRIAVVSIEYSLAPEFKFPAGFQDCLETVKWVGTASAQQRLSVDLDLGLLLGGTSAGGNFTAALAHACMEQSLYPQPRGLLFMASSFCHPDVRPAELRPRILSVDEVDDAPGLTVKSIRYFAEKYGAPSEDKRYSPMLHKSRKGLARKAFFQVCGWDPRRDEALLYAAMLEQDGILTQSKVYPGLPHGFWTTCPYLPESCAAIEDSVRGIEWLLAD